MKFNPEIEVLRAYAIILVLIAHLPHLFPVTTPVISYYWLGGGVDLFFCISGYLIASILLRALEEKHTFSSFYLPFFVKRVFRLWPAAVFWSVIAVLASAFFNSTHYFGPVSGNVNMAIANLFQVVNFNLVSSHYLHLSDYEPSALRVYWSLSLEEQFYFLFPLALFFVGKKKTMYIALLLVVTQLFLYREWPSPLWFFRTDAIALGVLIAYAHHKGYLRFTYSQATLPLFLKKALVVFLFMLLVLVAKKEVVWFYHGLVVVVSGILVLLASFNRGILVGEGKWRNALAYIGSRSYSLYLSHMIGIDFLREAAYRCCNETPSHTTHYLLFSIAYIVILILFSEFSYRVIEQPLRLKGRELSKKLRISLTTAKS